MKLTEKERESVQVIDESTIRVNLDSLELVPSYLRGPSGPKFGNNPFGRGWVTVSRRLDDLFVDDKKVSIACYYKYLTTGNHVIYNDHGWGMGDAVISFANKGILHPNIAVALAEHSAMIPPTWYKSNENRRSESRTVYFSDATIDTGKAIHLLGLILFSDNTISLVHNENKNGPFGDGSFFAIVAG